MDNYTVYHIHSDLSNLTVSSGADSITKYSQYLDKAEQLGMGAIAFSEHGSVLNHVNKKRDIESRGMKYIHANEIYLTKGIVDVNGEPLRERDNYHYMLMAKNYDGYLELNKLTSQSFNKDDGHFYFNPRITFDELKNTSDNILMTSACIASPIYRLYQESLNGNKNSERELDDLLNFMGKNKHRMFFEIQAHNHPKQIEFNQLLLRLSRDLDIPLIGGTDTHALNKEHAKARDLFIKSKGIDYGDEDSFDLTFKSYEEFVKMFEEQNALPRNIYLEAIHNTNVMADMVEPFSLDDSPKYPKLYDKPVEVFKEKINEGTIKRGIDKLPKDEKKVYFDRIKEEFKTYEKLESIDYMLLQKHIIDWANENGIYQGLGRGSVNGSLIAYLLGITEMDSVKHELNFFRFLNPNRISLPDIDIDFPPSRRQEVIDFIATIDGVDFSEIITFNTFALKGAIREVGRFLDMPLQEVDMISKSVETYNGKDHIDESYKKRYPELFKYVDLMVGVIFAMGSHPSGFVVSPVNLDETVSTLYTKDSKYKVSAVDMGELDSKNFVKLDVLGLMNIELINETCKIAGIERLTPDNVDINDIDVWKSMSESTLGVFQMESDSAQRYVKQLFSQETLDNIHNINPNASYIDLLSMANGAIRPSGNSYRYELSQGIMKDNGHDALNDFLKPTLGFLIFQEQIMEFLTKFANHTGSESDTVRRGLSKKKGTQQYLDKIRQGFSEFMKSEYNEKQESIDEIIEPFLKVISDASGYGFSDNHSKPYSYTGYIGAYLRYHYPLEFLTTALNLQDDDKEQTGKIINYAKSKKITIKPVEFGKSGSSYRYNKDENAIYKGIASIKYLNSNVAKELLDLEKTTSYGQSEFHLLVRDLIEKTSLNTRQAEILIRLDFFKRFGKKEVLLEIYLTMTDKKKPNTLKYEEFKDVVQKNIKVNKRTGEEKLVLKTIKKPVAYKNNLVDKTKEKRLENAKEYEEAVRENPPTKIELYEQIQFEKDNLGYAVSTFPELPDNVALVTEVNKKFTPLVTFYILNNGDEKLLKVKKKDFWSDDIDKLFVGDVVQIKSEFEEAGWRHLDGKFVRDENKIDKFLGNCRIIRPSKKRKS